MVARCRLDDAGDERYDAQDDRYAADRPYAMLHVNEMLVLAVEPLDRWL